MRKAIGNRAASNRIGKTMLAVALGLAAAACTTGTAEGPGAGAAAAPAWRSGMAIQLYTFHHDLERDLPGTLARVKALGFDRVETYSVPGVSAVQLRAALDAAGLRAVSAHMPFSRMEKDIAGVIADVKTLGAEQFGPGSIWLYDTSERRPLTLAEAERAGGILARACEAARPANLRVFIHTHGNEFAPVDGTTPLDRMLQAAGGCFDIEADIFWIQAAGVEPAELIWRHGSRVTSLHLKDMARGAVMPNQFTAPPEASAVLGQGKIDLPAVIRESRAAGVRHYIIEDESRDPAGQIPASLAYLDSLAGS